ncbi:MAG: tetratricopeptide repeat protein, partial [Polyangiaceae bacterium]
MGSGRTILWIALLAMAASVCGAPRVALAQTKAPTQNQIDAEEHFQKARALYKAGSYKEAIDELKKAHDLDPTAKDLVLNLSTVNERLGNIDDALDYMHQYEKMDLTQAEHDKAEQAIHRLEGAKKELDAKAEAERQRLAQQQQQQQQQNPQPAPESRPHGRIDALTIGAAAVAVAGFTVGTIFGLKALSDKPPASGFVTGTGDGANGSYQDLQDAASHSHSEAQISDVAFIVGGVATIGAAVLYFARTRDKHPPPSQGTTPPTSLGASNT